MPSSSCAAAGLRLACACASCAYASTPSATTRSRADSSNTSESGNNASSGACASALARAYSSRSLVKHSSSLFLHSCVRYPTVGPNLSTTPRVKYTWALVLMACKPRRQTKAVDHFFVFVPHDTVRASCLLAGVPTMCSSVDDILPIQCPFFSSKTSFSSLARRTEMFLPAQTIASVLTCSQFFEQF